MTYKPRPSLGSANSEIGSEFSFSRVEAVLIWVRSSLELHPYHSMANLPLPLNDLVFKAKIT